MTHNRLFIENLALTLTMNKDLFFSKGWGPNKNYHTFMNSLANAMYKKANMSETNLPIITSTVDNAESVRYVAIANQLDPSFVVERYDAYYFVIAFDSSYAFRVFSYELDYDKNNNIEYVVCEHTKDGKRIVIKKFNTLLERHFLATLYDILK